MKLSSSSSLSCFYALPLKNLLFYNHGVCYPLLRSSGNRAQGLRLTLGKTGAHMPNLSSSRRIQPQATQKRYYFPFPSANTRCSLRSHTELRNDAGGRSWLEKQIPRPRLCAGNAVPAAPRVRARRRTRGKGCSCPAAGPPVRPRALPTCSGPQFAVCKTGRVAAPTSMGGEN